MQRFLIFLLFGLLLVSGLAVWAEESRIAKVDRILESFETRDLLEQAISILDNEVTKDPGNYEALWRLGRCWQISGDATAVKTDRMIAFEKGLAFTERALKVNEQGVNGLLWHAVLMGSIAQEKNDLNSLKLINQMHDEVQTVIKLDPKNDAAHYILAQLFLSTPGKPHSIGDKKKALDAGRLAVKYGPEKANYWFMYGLVLMANNDFNTAKNALAKFRDSTNNYKFSVLVAREHQAEDYDSLWRLGYFYDFYSQYIPDKKERKASYEKGLDFAERAIKLNPKGVEGHLYRAILIGKIGLEKGVLSSLAMVKPMYEELQTVIRLDPENALGHYVLGLLFSKLPGKPLSIGDKQKALEEMVLAIKYDSKNDEYWFNYGKIALENKDYTTARLAFTKVLGFFDGYNYYKKDARKELDKLEKG